MTLRNHTLNRDSRLEATVIHDQTVFRGDLFEMLVSSDGKTWRMDSHKQTSDNPRGNYQLKSMRALMSICQLTGKLFILRRGKYSVWQRSILNYAEAKFELGDEATAREYVNKAGAKAKC